MTTNSVGTKGLRNELTSSPALEVSEDDGLSSAGGFDLGFSPSVLFSIIVAMLDIRFENKL